jgi:outer membrane immunogenic protein
MMKRVLLAAFLVGAMHSVTWADGVPAPYRPAWYPVWTGFYGGVNGGYGSGGTGDLTSSCTSTFGGTCANPDDPRFNTNGGFGGGQIGYNWQGVVFGPHVVLGIEADLQGSAINGKASSSLADDDGPIVSNTKSNLDWFGTLRGRLGYAFDRTLIYATGGFAFGGVRDKLSVGEPVEGTLAAVKNNQTATGYVFGGGVEYLFNRSWSVKVEYQYVNLGSTKLAVSAVDPDDVIATSVKVDHTYDTVRLGVNYKFGDRGDYAPLK